MNLVSDLVSYLGSSHGVLARPIKEGIGLVPGVVTRPLWEVLEIFNRGHEANVDLQRCAGRPYRSS